MINPIPAEFDILNILWELKEANTHTVNVRLSLQDKVGYTTTLKTMQVMAEKGLLDRRKEGQSHVYFTLIQESVAKGNLLTKFVNSTFSGSASNLMMQLLGNENVNQESLLVEINVKSLNLYSRNADRSYRNISAFGSRSTNYNRGANTSGAGISPLKDDIGSSSARKGTMAMASAFGTTQYLNGQFEITLLAPLTHQVVGHAKPETTIQLKHSAYRDLVEKIDCKNLLMPLEDILLLGLFEKVRTRLHKELQRIQQDEVSVKPIQLTVEQIKSLTDKSYVKTHSAFRKYCY